MYRRRDNNIITAGRSSVMIKTYEVGCRIRLNMQAHTLQFVSRSYLIRYTCNGGVCVCVCVNITPDKW